MKRIIIAILSILVLLLAGVGAYVFILLEQIPRAEVENVVPVDDPPIFPEEEQKNVQPNETEIPNGKKGDTENNPPEEQQTEPDNKKPSSVINILLLGSDEHQDDIRGRSDSMMIATVDKSRGKLKLTSLMRDMYLPIPGRRDNRLNAAYAFGGASLVMRTINENFDMYLEQYVVVDFRAFEKIIDIVGGIEIEITASEYRALRTSAGIDGYGLKTLSGRQALAYARLRSVGRDDFARVDRQQKVITKLFEKVSTTSFLRLPGILSAILPYVRTNISTLEIMSIGTSVLGFEDKKIHRFRLPVEGTYNPATIREMMVLVPDLAENTRLLHEFLYEE